MFDPKDMSGMFEKLQEYSKQAREEQSQQIFNSSVGGGMVDISINGINEVVELNIDDELLDDKDSLKILLISAINDVLKQAEKNKEQQAVSLLSKVSPKTTE
ncbi:MAG: nucleoid-associated protein, YbaB/EbfC family [Campylobacteraceae bacterium 4484_166]|nr:MAG: nucleoid-associated protein, YbaB/EbfC family [Campylobacteraceae bacterium 4484_166]